MWKTMVIALLVLFRITTGHAGMITLNSGESGRVVIVQFLLSTHIGADSRKVGEVMTEAIAYVSAYNIPFGQIIQGATNSAYQCEIVNGDPRKVILKVKKLQAGYAGEATCVAEVRLETQYDYPGVNLYIYNNITADRSYGPSYATLTPYGKKVALPRPWDGGAPWDGYYYYPKGGVSKWSATYDEQIQHQVSSESDPYVPIITVTDDSTTWAFVTATTKDVDAGFTRAVSITRKGGGPCTWINAGEQCFLYVNKDKLKSGVTKGLVQLNVQLP